MKVMANMECRPERGSFPLDHDGMIPSQDSSLPRATARWWHLRLTRADMA
jgi:hypothetical protein